MQNRREFLKKSGLLAGALGMWEVLDDSIQSAFTIEPTPGSDFMDAEHVVLLMQENRSFDHSFGTLQGVRGFNDPRAITLPNENPVWAQTNKDGKSYVPFRLDIKDTKITWMGGLPHSWTDQVDTRNNGKFDRWLIDKIPSRKDRADKPFTLGYYSRADIPFYYALADAFTICDQNFCSCLTGTTANRLEFWTGGIREKPSVDSYAHVLNENTDHENLVSWKTFPERLEDAGVSWKVYQNELSIATGFSGEEDPWLANFGCNPLEYFTQFNGRANKLYKEHLPKRLKSLTDELEKLEEKSLAMPLDSEGKLKVEMLRKNIAATKKEISDADKHDYDKLSPREKSLYDNAFVTNVADPNYRQVTDLEYEHGKKKMKLKVPKGDIFYQFRKDVQNGKLPMVSWIVPPQNFSDHPSSAWYGAWYISELINILTKNPEVWKKTIFIMTYDENDGYFDHVPPFVAPNPKKPETGKVSKSIDTTLEFVELEKDQLRPDEKKRYRESSIGLGYRVPMIIASPWSRGGCVCSEVFDHTSSLRFLEKFVSKKIGKPIVEENISSWRRAMCGDLTSSFQLARDSQGKDPKFVERNPFIQQIHQARFKPEPGNFKALSKDDIEQLKSDPLNSKLIPRQESGVRRSAPVPYDLHVNGKLNDDKTAFTISLEVKKDQFKERTAGCPFMVYARSGSDVTVRDYAVAAGEKIEDSWSIKDFSGGKYHLILYGPNGFMREFSGDPKNPKVSASINYERDSKLNRSNGNAVVNITNHEPKETIRLRLKDFSYGADAEDVSIQPGETISMKIDTSKSYRWYDFGILHADEQTLVARFAGRVETGEWGISDPAMGRVVGKSV